MTEAKPAKANNFFKTRLISLDVFRGATIAAMILVNNPGDWGKVYAPFLHAKWHGWTFTDLIFPFFLFIVGVAIVYALSRQVENDIPKKIMYRKIVRRTLILFGLGLFLSGFPFFDLSVIRIPGVLQRIAICYFFSSIIFLHTNIKGQAAWSVGLLLLYWALMEWIPVPGVGIGSYARGANLSNYLDQFIFGSHVWRSSAPWDPEGFLSTLPAISTTLFGVLTGHLLKSKLQENEKTIYMFLVGNSAILLGTIWHYWHPINKSIWTGSYAVVMAGLALVVLASLHFLIDTKGYKWFTKPAIVYGANAITVFVLSGIIAKSLYLIKLPAGDGSISLKSWIYNNLYLSWLSDYNASIAFAITFIFIMYLAMLYLYKKKIFIKI